MLRNPAKKSKKHVILSSLFLVLGFALTLILLFLHLSSPLSREAHYKRFNLKKGMGAKEIGESLEEAHLIGNALVFRALVKYFKADSRLKAGYYSLSPHLSSPDILNKMIKGEVITQKVIIPEGYTAVQIGLVLESKGITSSKEFVRAVSEYSIELPKVKGKEDVRGAEGYLFPDTYFFSWDMEPLEVVQHMVDQFKKSVFSGLMEYKGALSPSKVIILASLVETEAKLPEERPLVARVYLNRLAQGMNFECDATIQYLLEQHGSGRKEFLSFEDLKIDSPYNTYLYKGFPPGPIGNPGLSAIKAVLQPAKGKYLFYVLAGSDGSHSFSKNYKEHLQAVSRYKEFLRSQGK